MSSPEAVAAGRLGILVVNFGAHQLLRENLAGLDVDALDAVVVVVDNLHSSAERVAVSAVAAEHGWELVLSDGNHGFGDGMNQAAERAVELGCDRFLLLNPDVVIDAAAVARLDATLRERPGAVSARLLRPDGRTWFAGSQLDALTGLTSSRPDVEQTSDDRWLTAACLMVDRATWAACGGFDPAYFLYWEDVDLSRRIRDAGGGLWVDHDAVGVHSVGGTQGGEGKSPGYCYFNCRNRLLYASQHLPLRDRLRWVARSPTFALRVARRGGTRALLRRPGLLVAAARGTSAGVRRCLSPRSHRTA